MANFIKILLVNAQIFHNIGRRNRQIVAEYRYKFHNWSLCAKIQLPSNRTTELFWPTGYPIQFGKEFEWNGSSLKCNKHTDQWTACLSFIELCLDGKKYREEIYSRIFWIFVFIFKNRKLPPLCPVFTLVPSQPINNNLSEHIWSHCTLFQIWVAIDSAFPSEMVICV